MTTKPFTEFIYISLTEIRDVTLWSLWLSLPAAIISWGMGWATSVDNIDYVRVVLIAISIDHVFGTIAHSTLFKNDFSILQNIAGLGLKILVVILMGFIFHGLAVLVIKEDFIYRYLVMATRVLVFLYPAMSAMRNCNLITKGVFPPDALMMKGEKFKKTLDIRVFAPDNKEEEEQQ